MLQAPTKSDQIQIQFPQWMRGFLLIATIYNLAWGLFIYIFPDSFFQWVSVSKQNAPDLIAILGLVYGIFGLCYLVVALYPLKYWYLIFLGVISKLVGDFWLYLGFMHPHTNKKFLFHVIMNDLIWILPFIIIAITALKLKKNRPQ